MAIEAGTGEREYQRVALHDERAVAYWTERFSVTRAQLEEAVSAVGDDAHAVYAYLRGQGGGE